MCKITMVCGAQLELIKNHVKSQEIYIYCAALCFLLVDLQNSRQFGTQITDSCGVEILPISHYSLSSIQK